jgi:hypothetical protein
MTFDDIQVIVRTDALLRLSSNQPAARPTLEAACSRCLFMLLHVPAELIDNKLSRREQETLKPLILALSIIALILGALIWHRGKLLFVDVRARHTAV